MPFDYNSFLAGVWTGMRLPRVPGGRKPPVPSGRYILTESGEKIITEGPVWTSNETHYKTHEWYYAIDPTTGTGIEISLGYGWYDPGLVDYYFADMTGGSAVPFRVVLYATVDNASPLTSSVTWYYEARDPATHTQIAWRRLSLFPSPSIAGRDNEYRYQTPTYDTSILAVPDGCVEFEGTPTDIQNHFNDLSIRPMITE